MDWLRPGGHPKSTAAPTGANLRRSTLSGYARRSDSYACASLSRAPCIFIPIRTLVPIPDTLPDAETDANGNNTQRIRSTVTVESVAPLTNDSGVIVEPASVNMRKNPTTNEYVDPDITNKQITLTIPGKTFTGIEERWIEIKQGAIIRKAKTMINGVPVDAGGRKGIASASA